MRRERQCDFFTVKPVYNDHPSDQKIVAVVDKWSLLRDYLYNKSSKYGLGIVVVKDRWLLTQV
jgi:hypothetical protein